MASAPTLIPRSAVPSEVDWGDAAEHRIHLIKKNGYYLRSYQIDYGLDYLERTQNIAAPMTKSNCYASFWMLCIMHGMPNQMSVEANGRKCAVEGSMALFIPRFQPVSFHYQPGLLHNQAFVCFLPPDPRFPKAPTLFPWDPLTTISKYADLADILQNIENGPHIGLDVTLGHTPYAAHKAKKFLDDHFSEDFSIQAMFKDIKLSHSTATHSFSSHFGMSPIKYRNILRTFDALRRISLGQTVMEAAAEVGFQDYSRFYRNFQATIGRPPADFSRRGFTREKSDDPISQLRKINEA